LYPFFCLCVGSVPNLCQKQSLSQRIENPLRGFCDLLVFNIAA
jgi:hypothetical protein